MPSDRNQAGSSPTDPEAEAAKAAGAGSAAAGAGSAAEGPGPEADADADAAALARSADTRGPQLSTLVIADSPESWRAGGFIVDEQGICVLGRTAIHLNGGLGGFRSWVFDGIDQEVSEIDGLAVAGPNRSPSPSPSAQRIPNHHPHPNGITSIDHIVIRSGNCKRTIAALEAAGFPRRGGRTTTSSGFAAAQSFFWAGDVILELIGPDIDEPATDEVTSIFGLALVAPDLDSTAQFLGDLMGDPRPAVQKGRRIAGFRTRTVGISLPIAVMSPHSKP
ncbi:MAG: hypothetical protein WBA45_05090 [Microthrixaceae bacterium]